MTTLQEGLKKADLARAQRHIFICVGGECCPDPKERDALWDYIKRRVRETGVPAMRTKADCFRVCVGGPWLVVYPEGMWYGGVTPERFERILQEHLLGGRPVEEWVAAKNDLGCSSKAD